MGHKCHRTLLDHLKIWYSSHHNLLDHRTVESDLAVTATIGVARCPERIGTVV